MSSSLTIKSIALLLFITALTCTIAAPELFAQDAEDTVVAPLEETGAVEALAEKEQTIAYYDSEASEASTDDANYPKFDPDSSGGMILGTIKALLIVLIGICLLVYVLKKFHGGGVGAVAGAKSQVLNRIFLSSKATIFVVKVVDRILLVGVSSGSVQLLSEITRPEEVARFETGSSPFGGTLVSAIKKGMHSASLTGGKTLSDPVSEIKEQTERIRKIAEGESGQEE